MCFELLQLKFMTKISTEDLCFCNRHALVVKISRAQRNLRQARAISFFEIEGTHQAAAYTDDLAARHTGAGLG